MSDIADRLNNLAEKLARFPAGKSVDVPAYLEEKGNPDAAERWREEHDKNKDKFKGGGDLSTRLEHLANEIKSAATS